MNLVVDLGNTRDKLALFEKGKIIRSNFYKDLKSKDIESFCKKSIIESVIIASVTRGADEAGDYLRRNFRTIILDSKTPIPIRNAYASPETLGNDRLACAVGAAGMFPGKNVLSVDAGTCIKFDFVSDDGSYRGGAISPGLEMRLKAMHTFTARLPLVKLSKTKNLVGDNTVNSLLSGAVNGAIHEVDATIRKYKANYPALKVILTGGDMSYFEETVKSRIFAVPNLLLQGLNLILEYNDKNK